MSDQEIETNNVSNKRANDDGDEEEGQNEDTNDNQEENSGKANPFRSDEPKKKKKKSDSAADAIIAQQQTVDGSVPQITSRRQKKRMKNVQVQAQRKDDDNVRTIAYLTKWQENRSEWKFEKLRQITIQKNILNEKIISDEQFEVALAYLATTKGVARAHIIETAEKTIEKFETDINDENRDEILNSREYKRAREVIQTMN